MSRPLERWSSRTTCRRRVAAFADGPANVADGTAGSPHGAAPRQDPESVAPEDAGTDSRRGGFFAFFGPQQQETPLHRGPQQQE